MRIAFLGLGRMGQAIAAHIAASENHLTVWNRTPGKAQELLQSGATEAGSIAEAVEGADVVAVMVAGPEALEEVLGEVLAAAPQGSLVLDMSTVGPAASRAAAQRCEQAGLRFVDAPVAGSVGPAQRRELGVFLGGSQRDVASVTELVGLWADPDRVAHVGPVGSGSALKLAVNLTLGVAISGVGEAMRLAHDLGLGQDVVLEALSHGPLGWTLAQKRPLIEKGDYDDPGFTLDLVAKDLDLCLSSAHRELPVVQATRTEMAEAIAAGHGAADYSVLAGYLADEGHANSQ